MLLDDLQKTWQSQPTARIDAAAEELLREVRQNQRSFRRTIFWRDFREVFAAVVMTMWFTWQGWSDKGWPWVLLGGLCLWVGGFILVDRFRRRGRAARFGDSLLGCVEASLEDVEHQVWLLKNVFWWYILPPGVGMAIAIVHTALGMDDAPAWLAWGVGLVVGAICATACVWVYRINQAAVRKELEPRRQELLAMRESLMMNDD